MNDILEVKLELDTAEAFDLLLALEQSDLDHRELEQRLIDFIYQQTDIEL